MRSAMPGPTSPVAADERDALAVIAGADGIGPITVEHLIERFGTGLEVLRVARGAHGGTVLQRALRDAESVRQHITAPAAAALVRVALDPDVVLGAMRAAGVHSLVIGDPTYPARLRLIELPPRVLFVRGADTALESPAIVAVVGTRRPTDQGRRTAHRIGSALARAGAVVVSGLALGVDGAAHAAAVESSGTTVAVIGGGHGHLAPVAHDRLAAAIVAAGGAVISEHAPGVPPSRGTFPRRNRLISGLADAVVVVEAGVRSGALLTAAWALEQGRELFLVPGPIDSPESAGCLAWLRDFGGLTRIVAGVPQLLEDLGLAASASFPELRSSPVTAAGSGDRRAHPGQRANRQPSLNAVALDLPTREGSVLRAMAAGAATADEIAAVVDLPIGAVLAGLTGLETRGLVAARYGRYDVTGLGAGRTELGSGMLGPDSAARQAPPLRDL